MEPPTICGIHALFSMNTSRLHLAAGSHWYLASHQCTTREKSWSSYARNCTPAKKGIIKIITVKKQPQKKTHKNDLLLVHRAQLIELFAYMETELCQWRSRIQFGKGRGVINTFTLRVAEGGQYMTAIGTNYNSSMWSSLGEAPANLVFYRVHFRYIWKNHTFVSIYADLYSKM